MRRVADPQGARESVEQAVRIRHLEAEVEQTSAHTAVAPSGAGRRRVFQQARLGETVEEGPQTLRGKRPAETRFRPLPDNLERRLAVALLRDEMLDVAETEEVAGARVLYDRDGAIRCAQLADDQVPPQPWRRRAHGATGTMRKAAGKFPTAFPTLPIERRG